MPEALATPPRVVWARKSVSTCICPRSFITAQSLAWLEEFLVLRKVGGLDRQALGAREAEAFLILQEELTAETNHG